MRETIDLKVSMLLAAQIAVLTGCATVSVQGVGKIKWSDICEKKTCGISGVHASTFRRGLAPLYVTSVDDILGTKLGPSFYANPDTCGQRVTAAQYDTPNQTSRTVEASEESTRGFTVGLRGQIAEGLTAGQAYKINADANAAISRALKKSLTSKLELKVATYTLKSEVLLEREKLCAPTEEETLVRSVVLMNASSTSVQKIADNIKYNLSAEAGIIAAAIGGAEADVKANLDKAADEAVTEAANNISAVLVVGWDK